MQPSDFKLIANAVLIGVVQAIARAVVIRFGIITVTCIRSCCIVVASSIVLAASDFILVTYLIVVRIKQAVRHRNRRPAVAYVHEASSSVASES